MDPLRDNILEAITVKHLYPPFIKDVVVVFDVFSNIKWPNNNQQACNFPITNSGMAKFPNIENFSVKINKGNVQEQHLIKDTEEYETCQ